MGQDIELHIEKLVLHGFPHADRSRIAAAVQQELTRLFMENGLPATLSSGSIPDLDAGSFNFAAGTKPSDIGTQIATSVYSGFAQ